MWSAVLRLCALPALLSSPARPTQPVGAVFLCLAFPQSPDPGWLPVPLSSQQHPLPTAPSHSPPTPTSPSPSRTPGGFQLEVSISSWSWAACLPWLLESRSLSGWQPRLGPLGHGHESWAALPCCAFSEAWSGAKGVLTSPWPGAGPAPHKSRRLSPQGLAPGEIVGGGDQGYTQWYPGSSL